MVLCMLAGGTGLLCVAEENMNTANAATTATPSYGSGSTTYNSYSGKGGTGMAPIPPGYIYAVPVYDQSQVFDVGEVIRSANKNNQVSIGSNVASSYFAKSKKASNLNDNYYQYVSYYQALIREQTSLIYVPQNEASLIFLPHATIYTKNNNSIVNRSYLP
jgi:hypothetical protein